MNSSTLYIRPSQALSMDECGFAMYLKYILQVKQDITPANLPFGTAVHEACTGYILAEAAGDSSFDPEKTFNDCWEEAINTEPMDFSSLWGPEDLRNTGLRLVELFPAKWKETGLTPLIDEVGPVVERRFEVEIEPGLILTGQPDVVAMDDEGGVIPLDIKTTASPYDEIFLLASDQLTDYQILVEGNGEQLGLGDEGINAVGFFEGIKRKIPKTGRGKGPEFINPAICQKRSDERISERKQKLSWMADDMRKGRYTKKPRMAFNTPCGMCEFADFCLKGDRSGLSFPSEPQKSIALAVTDSAPLI